MKSLLGRLRYRRLASTFTILATLSAGILIGSVVAHGVHGQESKQTQKIDTSDATPLKVPAPRDLSTDFTRIAKEVGPAVVNISTVTLPKSERPRHGHNFNGSPFQQQQPPDGGDDDDQGDQGQGQGQGNFQDFFNHFFGGGPGVGGDRMKPAKSANHSAPASLSIHAATSSPTTTSSKKPTRFGSGFPPTPTTDSCRAVPRRSLALTRLLTSPS